MIFNLKYSYLDQSGKETVVNKGKIQIEEDKLSLIANNGSAILITYRDIINIASSDFQIILTLTSNEKIALFDLGYKFEDLKRIILNLRNEIIIKDMLAFEATKKPKIDVEFFYSNKEGEIKGNGQFQLNKTAFLLIPEKEEIKRIRYGTIVSVNDVDYVLTIKTELGEIISLSKMGYQHDSYKETLNKLIAQLELDAQELVKKILPEIKSDKLKELALLFKEGKAVTKKGVVAIVPEFWPRMEARLESFDLKKEYDFLNSFSNNRENIAFGFKKGLMGSSDEYLWLLIPIYSSDPKKPGNAIALIAQSEKEKEEGKGKATYFFRIKNRSDYAKIKDLSILSQETENLIKKINQAMLEINFRREPLYLSEEKLNEPENISYKFAVNRLEALRYLRKLCLGRIIHSNPKQWEKDITEILNFNVSTTDDEAIWQKKN